jgi:flagellar hook-associated protein 1 FlgK
MSGLVSRIMNNAISALSAQQSLIAVTSNNVSNVDTDGYSRRTVELSTREGASSGLSLGNGVEVSAVTRQTSSFVEEALQETTGELAQYEVEDEYLDRLEGLFSFDDDVTTIGTAVNDFFAAVDDLTLDPSSSELRANFIECANELATAINVTYNEIADLQTEADERIASEVETINSLTAQIAELNGEIRIWESSGDVAADQRDQRDQLLQKLSEKLSFEQVELDDGTVTISLADGFPLVSGTYSRDLEVTSSPSFTTGGAPSLDGGQLSYIVYDFSDGAGTSQIDLTSTIAEGSGTLGGLLSIRGVYESTDTSAFDADGTLVEIATQVEAIARQLLTSVNQEYAGGSSTTSGDLNGNTTGVFGLFTFSGATDADSDGVATTADLTASGEDNFASLISVAISSTSEVAAARDSSTTATPSYPEGDGQNMEALSDLQTQDFTFALGSYSLTDTFSGAYNDVVNTVGNERSKASVNLTVASSNYATASQRREEISGVSLDEEFTNLIQYQQAFQAAARLISVAGELIDQIVEVV